MKLVFMGTPEFAVASLDALIKAGHEVAAVVTMPDKPAGRGQNPKVCRKIVRRRTRFENPSARKTQG